MAQKLLQTIMLDKFYFTPLSFPPVNSLPLGVFNVRLTQRLAANFTTDTPVPIASDVPVKLAVSANESVASLAPLLRWEPAGVFEIRHHQIERFALSEIPSHGRDFRKKQYRYSDTDSSGSLFPVKGLAPGTVFWPVEVTFGTKWPRLIEKRDTGHSTAFADPFGEF